MFFKRQVTENKELATIFLIVLVDVLSLTIIIPLLPFYAEKFGATAQTVGLLITAFAFCQFLAGPILGELSDRMGRKPILLLSQIGTFIGLLIFAQATTLTVIFIARIIDGITAGNLTVAQAYISDRTPPQKRAQSFAMLGIAFGIGFLIGPSVSGLLAGRGMHFPIFVAAGLSFCSILCTTFLLPREAGVAANKEHKKILNLVTQAFDPRMYMPFFRREELRGLLIQMFLYLFSFTMFVGGFALFAERQLVWNGHPFGAREVGYYMGFMGAVGIIVQAKMVGWLVKKWGERKLMNVGLFSMCIGYSLMGFVHSLWVLPFVAIIANFGAGVVRPSVTSLISQTSGRSEQGAVMGVAQSLGSMGQILAPILAGFLIEKHWLIGWSCTAGFMALTGLLFYHRNYLKRPNQKPIADQPQKITT
jgi:MFS family permease